MDVKGEYMLNYDYCYIGRICEVLDNTKANYHHCNTWFTLFLQDREYAITAEKNNNSSEVVVRKGLSSKGPIIFKGSLQEFENWLITVQRLPQEPFEISENEKEPDFDR